LNLANQLLMCLFKNLTFNLTTSPEDLIESIMTMQWKFMLNWRRMVWTLKCLWILGRCTTRHSLSQEWEDMTWFNNTWTCSNTSKTIWMKTSQTNNMLPTSCMLLNRLDKLSIQSTMMVNFQTLPTLTHLKNIQLLGPMLKFEQTDEIQKWQTKIWKLFLDKNLIN